MKKRFYHTVLELRHSADGYYYPATFQMVPLFRKVQGFTTRAKSDERVHASFLDAFKLKAEYQGIPLSIEDNVKVVNIKDLKPSDIFK